MKDIYEEEREELEYAMGQAIRDGLYALIRPTFAGQKPYTIQDLPGLVYSCYHCSEEDIQRDYCNRCKWQYEHIQRCLTCRRNRDMKDNFEERNLETCQDEIRI